ncbi:MAG TPA: PadR family transcriptional regulator [Thermoplasmata archaeon]|nr:PadR family transcriptional regulator [Thermoplasmata archaeon]
MWHTHKKRGLRNWVVMIVRRRPRNGAEVMDDMELMTRGWWRPSPGSVYPLLEEMVKEGTLRKRDDGRYELVETKEAKEWDWALPHATRSVQDVARELRGLASYLEDLHRAEPASTASIEGQIDEVVERLRRLKNN